MTTLAWDEDAYDEKILASLALERECMQLEKLTNPLQDIDKKEETYENIIDFDDASKEWQLRGYCVAVSSSTGLRCRKTISKKYQFHCHSHGMKFEK